MASEASRKKAKELCYFEHDSRHDDKCGNCALIAAALDEAYAAGCEDGKKEARSLAASLQQSNNHAPAGHSCSCPWKCDYCDEREGERACGE